jgi:DNA modification methylase
MEKKLLKGNNLELLKTLEFNSVDSVVTDAPYGLSFMNKKWDYDVPSVEFWTEVYRVLKPGGHILCFGGTRTYHRMVVNIEDAGFEIRDCIQWIYGSGFPKSLNVGKEIDKLQGNEREEKEIIFPDGSKPRKTAGHFVVGENIQRNTKYTKGQTQYEGWGTGLKPANEPIVLARKPIWENTIAKNVLEFGTGGINIDGCRIGYVENDKTKNIVNYNYNLKDKQSGVMYDSYDGETKPSTGHKEKIMVFNDEGRFPTNVILECTCDDDIHTNPECPCYIMDEQSGGTSRFFYQAKVSKKERNMGLDGFEEKERFRLYETDTIKNWSEDSIKYQKRNPQKNNHPTVKPINLLTYLVRMVTPPNGVVLDAYMGSGSTGIAALLEGFKFIGMEMDDDYFNIAEARINNYEEYRKLLK